MTFSNKQKGILALIGLAFTYASFGFFTRYLSVSFGFFQQLYLRIFAVIIGFIIYREVPSIKDFFGGALILFSVIQMNKLK